MSLCQSHFHRCCLILLYIGHPCPCAIKVNADIVSFGLSCPCAIAYNDVIMQYYCCNIYVILITDLFRAIHEMLLLIPYPLLTSTSIDRFI